MSCQRVLLCFFCIVLLLCPLSVSRATGPGAAPLGTIDYSGSGAALQVLRGAPEYTSISLSSSNVVIEDKTLGFEIYKSFGISGEPFIMEEGVPEVPLIARFYRIPNTGGVDLVLSNAEDFELIEGVKIMPYQVEGSDHFGMARSAVMDQDAWYPPNVAEMSEPMIMRDFRVVRVALHPVQVNPVRHQARIYHNLQAEIVANDRPSVNEITNPGPPSGSWVPIYRNLLPNLTDAELDDETVIPGRMMIMCKNNPLAREWADSLRIWKKRKGFDVFIDSTHTNTAAQMITYIQQVYATPGPKLEFVCLIGDPDWTYGVPTGSGYDFDHGFGLGNAGDDLADIAVGRLSGDASQLATIHAKIMGYERTPHMENSQGQADTMWFHKGFFYAGTAYEIASNYTVMQWGAQEFRNWTGVDSTFVDYFPGQWNVNLACSQLAGGVSFFLIRPAYVGEISQLSSCGSTWRLPVAFVITCNANDFSGGTGYAEGWVREGTPTAPKGVVACAGTSTSGTYAPENITLTGGMMYSMANLHLEHYGDCAVAAEYWLTKMWGAGSTPAHNFSRYFNVMGDPSLSMWTDVPNVVDVDHPTTVNVGTRHMAVTVTDADNGAPIADALVVLWKGTETWIRGVTDVNGQIELPITVNSGGNLLLTVTKRNHKPYLYTINCVQAAQMVTVSSYTVDDDNSGGTNGNNNDLLNPGETIDLPVYLRNFGTSSTATNVSATVASDNPHVTIVNSSSTFANLAPGDSALSAPPFRIQVSPVMAHNETALLTLTITASSIQTFSSLELTNHAGQADYVSHLFTGTVNPGTTNNLRVTLRNSGEVTLAGATAQLASLSPFVQVDDAGGTFGDIPPTQNVTNSVDQFTLTSNSLTFRGHQAPMRLILSTTDGFVDTTQFTVSIGAATATDPTGPDAYGYYAYDNADISYEMHPTFSYVNISAGGGVDLNINDPGEKILPTQIYSVVRPLPFPFTFYGQSYDTITICANGWLAFGNQAQLDLFRNYPMPAMEAPDAMIAPYWDDLRTDGAQGVWKQDDLANHRCIIQWKAAVYTGGTMLDFEVILLDTAFYPTFDGNGQILVQYNDVSMGVAGDYREPNGCDIGIQAPRGLVALQYAWLNNYMPGSATVTDGRAILFTTNARMLFGAVQGTVLDAETNQPLPGVDVTIDGYSYHVVTDASGHYLLDDVLIGMYTVRAHKSAFNDATVANVVVELDSTETVNFSMLHPELTLSVDTLYVSVPEQPSQATFDIVNGGNGPLDFALTIAYAGDESPDPWDSLGVVNVSQVTGDAMIQGVEFAGDTWYVSGTGTGGQPTLYRFDPDGAYVGSIPQPASGIGWFDLAYDGQYLYGSEQRSSGGGLITGIALNGQVQTTIPSPVNPSRAIAYDPDSDHFWVADLSTDIYEIARDGTIEDQVPNDGNPVLNITGLAWHEMEADGFKLLLFCNNGSGTQLWKMHPVSHDLQFVTTLTAIPGDHAGGLAITPGWNSTLLVLGGILQGQGSSGDHLGIYEVTFNTTWIDVSPMQAIVPGSQTQEVTVTFDPTYLRTDTYRVNLRIHSDVLDSTYVLPVVLDVVSSVPDARHPGLPTVYALYQNYPNPFNPSTDIMLDLPNSGAVKLHVYNTLGQRIRTLVDGVRAAGSYHVFWDGRSDQGISVAAGVYIYRIETPSFVSSKKMVLLR